MLSFNEFENYIQGTLSWVSTPTLFDQA